MSERNGKGENGTAGEQRHRTGAEVMEEGRQFMEREGPLPAGKVDMAAAVARHGQRPPIMLTLALLLGVELPEPGAWVPTEGLEAEAEAAGRGEREDAQRHIEQRVFPARRAVAHSVAPFLGACVTEAMLALEELPDSSDGRHAVEQQERAWNEAAQHFDRLDARELTVALSFASSLHNQAGLLAQGLVGTILRRHPYVHGLLLGHIRDGAQPVARMAEAARDAYAQGMMLHMEPGDLARQFLQGLGLTAADGSEDEGADESEDRVGPVTFLGQGGSA